MTMDGRVTTRINVVCVGLKMDYARLARPLEGHAAALCLDWRKQHSAVPFVAPDVE